jgi:elongation factor G
VLDGGVGVFCGSGGVEPQSETNWRYANESEVARIIFVNKLDRIGADFYRVVKQVENVLAAKPAGHGPADRHRGRLRRRRRPADMKAYVWDDSGQPENFEIKDIPEDMVDKVEEYREKLIETAVEQDDDLMEAYLEGERAVGRGPQALHPQGHDQPGLLPDLLRLGVQEQGYPAGARRGRRLPAEPDRSRAAARGRPRGQRDRREGHGFDPDRPLRALAFKIMDDRTAR